MGQTLHNAGRLRAREANGAIIDEHGHGTFNTPRSKPTSKVIKTLDAIDVTARYFVYKVYDY